VREEERLSKEEREAAGENNDIHKVYLLVASYGLLLSVLIALSVQISCVVTHVVRHLVIGICVSLRMVLVTIHFKTLTWAHPNLCRGLSTTWGNH